MEGADTRRGSAPAEPEGAGGSGAGSHRAAAPSPLTPARAGMGCAPASADAPSPAPRAEVSLEREGVRWVVRALGQGGSPKAPLLLVGFFHPDDSQQHRREALIVGRAVEHLTELQIEAAWQAGGPPVPTDTRRPFFPEIAARGAQEGQERELRG